LTGKRPGLKDRRVFHILKKKLGEGLAEIVIWAGNEAGDILNTQYREKGTEK